MKTSTAFLVLSCLLSFMIVAQGENSAKSPEMLAVEAAGGLVLPLPGGGWEVEFHLRGRDALTDDGLKTLSPLGEVFSLNLRDTRITSEGLVHIGKLTGLRKLHLERTKVDDAGLAHLSDLKELEYLNLYQTEVSDEGLKHLSGLKKLQSLYLWQTKVSDEGAAKLRKALPSVRISLGLDLEKLAAAALKPDPPESRESLKWLPHGGAAKPPSKSVPGSFIRVNFKNQGKEPVKLTWIDYGGGKKFYAEIASEAVRDQTTYSQAVWLISDLSDKPLGYFVTGKKNANAFIPKK